MKTQLTAEESAKLLELGVSFERASGRTFDPKDVNNLGKPIERRELFHVFKLADLIDILPKKIEIDKKKSINLVFYWNNGKFWGAYYDNGSELKTAPELIDALYSLLVWCLEKGYVK